MAKNTTEFTTQVEPKSSAMCTTRLGLEQHEARAEEEHLPFGRMRSRGANASRMAADSKAITSIPWPIGAHGISRARRYRCGQSSLGQQDPRRALDPRRRCLVPVRGGRRGAKALAASVCATAALSQKLPWRS